MNLLTITMASEIMRLEMSPEQRVDVQFDVDNLGSWEHLRSFEVSMSRFGQKQIHLN